MSNSHVNLDNIFTLFRISVGNFLVISISFIVFALFFGIYMNWVNKLEVDREKKTNELFKKYIIQVKWSDKDKKFIASALELSNVQGKGETPEEAVKWLNIEYRIDQSDQLKASQLRKKT